MDKTGFFVSSVFQGENTESNLQNIQTHVGGAQSAFTASRACNLVGAARKVLYSLRLAGHATSSWGRAKGFHSLLRMQSGWSRANGFYNLQLAGLRSTMVPPTGWAHEPAGGAQRVLFGAGSPTCAIVCGKQSKGILTSKVNYFSQQWNYLSLLPR
jgi:hypothetical protein